MTRKHFEAIANIIKTHPAAKSTEVRSLGWDMADYFATVNPNFDRKWFLAAAGIYSEDN